MTHPALRRPVALRMPPERTGSGEPTPSWSRARRAALAALTAMIALLLIGADNRIVLSVLPTAAAFGRLAVDALNDHRLRRGRAPLPLGGCSALLGTVVLASALVVFSAT